MKKIVCIVLMPLLLFGACTGGNTAPSDYDNADNASIVPVAYLGTLAQQPIEPLNETFINGVNGFGFDAVKRLYSSDENLAFSPASITLALCMTREGAAGDTEKEMAQTLGLSGMSDEQITDTCRSLMWRANTGGMEAANAIWFSSEYTFADDFVGTCTKDYMADAYPLVIPGAKDMINAWAEEKTHGRIRKIIFNELDTLTGIVLANALYYLGDWDLPFEANDTSEREFMTPSGSVKTDFMHSDRYVPYYSGDGFSMISLGFKSSKGEGQYAMAFLLPDEGTAMEDMLTGLDAGKFATALGGAEEQEVWIRLPKFEFSCFAKLNDTLKKMGMVQPFDAVGADFSPMTKEQNELFIDEVLHKCYIRVDELGAEAAAVTVVDVEGSAVLEEEPPKFYADRPFVFAIYSLEDGAIAFLGVVNDPTQQ